MDFKEIVDCIFVNKHKYKNISDKDKENSFYIINKKFSLGFPNLASSLNNKNINKATALDIWFNHFRNVYSIPGWYWMKSPFKKEKKKKISETDTKNLMSEFEISKDEFDFIQKNFEDELDYELKILKRWK